MRLYHYQRILKPHNTDDNLTIETNFINSIINNKIYLSPFVSLNDPYESSFPLSFRGIDHNTFSSLTKEYYKNPDNEIIYGSARNWLQAWSPNISANFTRNIRTKYGVFCLTSDPCNLPMWAYYADNHYGLVLEYEIPEEMLSKVQRVKYLSKYPKISVKHLMSEDIQIKKSGLSKLFLSKHKSWKHESELRMYEKRTGIIDSPFKLTGIIFGHKIPETIISDIRNQSTSLNVEYKYAHINNEYFKIDLRDEIFIFDTRNPF